MSNIKTTPFSRLSSEAYSVMEEIKQLWDLYGWDVNCELFNKAYLLSLDWCLQNNHRLLQVADVGGILMVTYVEGGDNCTIKSK